MALGCPGFALASIIGRIEHAPFGTIFHRRQRMDHVEALDLVDDLEVSHSFTHQVSNVQAINFSLFHLVVWGVELGALLLNQQPPPFYESHQYNHS
jgi:hypothetical protein